MCNLYGIDIPTYFRVYVFVRVYITWKEQLWEKNLY